MAVGGSRGERAPPWWRRRRRRIDLVCAMATWSIQLERGVRHVALSLPARADGVERGRFLQRAARAAAHGRRPRAGAQARRAARERPLGGGLSIAARPHARDRGTG